MAEWSQIVCLFLTKLKRLKIKPFCLFKSVKLFTFETSESEAVIAWTVTPGVSILCAKSVYTVLIRIIVWSVWRPESKATCAFLCPHEWSFYASIIKPNPGSLSIVPMLNVDILFLTMDCHKMWAHFRTFCQRIWPSGVSGACEITITIEIIPSRLA